MMSFTELDLSRDKGVLPLLSFKFTAAALAFSSSVIVSLSPFSQKPEKKNRQYDIYTPKYIMNMKFCE